MDAAKLLHRVLSPQRALILEMQPDKIVPVVSRYEYRTLFDSKSALRGRPSENGGLMPFDPEVVSPMRRREYLRDSTGIAQLELSFAGVLVSNELLHRVLSPQPASMFETRCDKHDLKMCICNIERNATISSVIRRVELP